MFKKTEESEWTRFSRALQSQPAPRDEVAEREAAEEEETLELRPVGAVPAATEDRRREDVTPVPTLGRPESSYTQMDTPVQESREYDTGEYEAREYEVPESEARESEARVYQATDEPDPAPTPAPVSASAPRAELADPDETVLGEGARLEGTIRSDRSVRVRGMLSGEIESRGHVTIEGTARVEARIVADGVTVIGEVSGQIECGGRVEIAPTGRVTGEVRTGTLVIQEGAFFQGQLTMVPKDGPIGDDVPVRDDADMRDELDADPIRSPQSGQSTLEEDATWSSARAPSSSSS